MGERIHRCSGIRSVTVPASSLAFWMIRRRAASTPITNRIGITPWLAAFTGSVPMWPCELALNQIVAPVMACAAIRRSGHGVPLRIRYRSSARNAMMLASTPTGNQGASSLLNPQLRATLARVL